LFHEAENEAEAKTNEVEATKLASRTNIRDSLFIFIFMNLKQVCHCKHSSIFYHFRIISRWRTAWLWNRGHWKWHHSI